MARLTGTIFTSDDIFSNQVNSLLRSGAVPVAITGSDGGHDAGTRPDIVIVDARMDRRWAISQVEQLRAASTAVGIFVVTLEATPDLLLQAMRAGANEVLTWPVEVQALDEAVRRGAARRAAQPGGRPHATTLVFVGAKGGSGTTTIAMNCAIDVARLGKRPTVIVDLKTGLGEVTLFAGVRNQYSILDAMDNLYRLDIDFLRELLVKHKSGLDILAGSDQFERPGAEDGPAVEQVFRLLTEEYAYVVVDAGCHLNASTIPVMYTADTIFVVANPDVPSVRNAQRIVERIAHLGPCGDRVRIVLNRVNETPLIPLSQIEAALGQRIHQTFPSDYKAVAGALNAGIPLALTDRTDLGKAFASFTKRILDPSGDAVSSHDGRTLLRFGRLAAHG